MQMKRLLVCGFLSLLVLLPLSAKKNKESEGWDALPGVEDPDFEVYDPFQYEIHLVGGFAFVRDGDLAPMGGLSLGFSKNTYGIELYGQTELILDPAGSDSGKNASGEFMIEGGLRFIWNLFQTEAFISHFTFDAGFYAQHVSLPDAKNDYYRMHNGIIIRPAIGTVVWRGRIWQMELAVGYQKTVYPAYKDYDGVVIMAKIF